MSDEAPRVSILIPNYNNGRGSSASGEHDLIGRLLRSLQRTLAEETTPFEIIALDDGSTDDSLDTLRAWAEHTRPDGCPFLELIEREHCGVLSKTANHLSRQARGDILARLDGDVECLTPDWVTKLCAVFDDGPPGLGVVGPKQLRPDGRLHAFGDWVLHPNGYHHIAAGADRYAVRWPIEVDHVMGCFYCCRRRVFEELGGYDETLLRGQTVDFGLRARLAGWSCRAIPQVEFTHNHGLRRVRSAQADSERGLRDSVSAFEDKWGFHRIAPDLDDVRRRYRGTPLLWHARWANGGAPADPPDPPTLSVEQSDWARYAQQQPVQQSVNGIVGLTQQTIEQLGVAGTIAQVNASHGLIAHLLAAQGHRLVGVDRSRANVELARQCVSQKQYPGEPPRFVQQAEWSALPLADDSVELLLLIHAMEKHPNPVRLLKEAKRVLKPGGAMLIVARRRRTLDGLPTDREHPYRCEELLNQLHVTGGWQMLSDPKQDDPRHDIVLLLRRLQQETDSAQGQTQQADSAPQPELDAV